ncbi:MAG: hypothetical protein ACLTMP_04305 [Eggerthella lenta]
MHGRVLQCLSRQPLRLRAGHHVQVTAHRGDVGCARGVPPRPVARPQDGRRVFGRVLSARRRGDGCASGA